MITIIFSLLKDRKWIVTDGSIRFEIFDWSPVAFNKGKSCYVRNCWNKRHCLRKSRTFLRWRLTDGIFRLTWGCCRMKKGVGMFGTSKGVKGETGRGRVTRINSSVTASLNLLCLASTKFVQVHSSMFINRGIIFLCRGENISSVSSNNSPGSICIIFACVFLSTLQKGLALDRV